MNRRDFLAAAGAPLLLAGCASAAPPARDDVQARLRGIEREAGGRIGVFALETRTRAVVEHRGGERFALCSTFKLPLCAAVLARVDAGELALDRPVRIGPEDLVPYAPVVTKRMSQGSMRVRDLCEATMTLSDNAAANLLLGLVGSSAGVTAFMRSMGDPETRLDRVEPGLNTNLPGDPRDTTTPRAIVGSMEAMLLGTRLAPPSRAQLTAWMVHNETGARRIRAGVPEGWTVGDKTGTGANGAVNDVAILWPPGRAPILLAIYMDASTADTKELEKHHARIARVVLERYSTTS